jgi:tetraacyldisaccharide 4'-kinase
MLADLLPDVPHLQDRDRVRAASQLVDRGLDVILVDDGFQHRRLARDVDIVLVDALRPFGLPIPTGGGAPVEAPLPRGLMREPMAALARASAVVLTRADAVEEADLERLQRRIEGAAPGVPVLRAQHAPVAFRDARDPDRRRRPLADLKGLEVDLFSGIGNPGAFEVTVRELGAVIHSHRRFPDHHPFAPGELDGLGEDRPALTTAKDAARLAGLPEVEGPGSMFVLDVEMEITRGAPVLDALLDALPPTQRSRERAAIHEGLHG